MNDKDQKETIQFLRDAVGYLEHATDSVREGQKYKARQSMQRVRECLTEASWYLRGRKIKNGGRA